MLKQLESYLSITPNTYALKHSNVFRRMRVRPRIAIILGLGLMTFSLGVFITVYPGPDTTAEQVYQIRTIPTY